MQEPMNMRRTPIMRRAMPCFLFLVLAALSAQSEIVEPHFVLYGSVTVDGAQPAPETPISLTIGGEEIVSYRVGEASDLGDLYALRVPLDAVGERLTGHARTGDEAQVFVEGELAAVLTIGPAGRALPLDLDPAALNAGIFISDIDLFEGDSGTLIATLTVSLTQTSPLDVEVDFTTRDGSAVSGSDYVPRLGRAIVPAGAENVTIDVEILGDLDIEPDEEFFVDLSSPLGGVLLDPEGRVGIFDDDTPPAISVGDLSVTEPNPGLSQSASFAVQLSRAWDMAVSFDFAAVDVAGGAQNGADYLLEPDTVVMPAGVLTATIDVTIHGDLDQEDDERFELHLSNPANATIGDGLGQATISEFARILRWIEQHADAAEEGGSAPGLSGAFDVALSPDGQNVYVAGRASDALAVFTRNGDGTLIHLATYENDVDGVSGLDGVEAVLVSADGSKVFAASFDENAVVSFVRNGDGTLVFADVDFDGLIDPDSGRVVDGLEGATGLAEASDTANHLYVAGFLDDAVAVFSIQGDGTLEYETAAEDGVFGADGLAQASSIEIAANGTDVYVTGYLDDSVARFTRNPSDGFLTFREIHVDGAGGVFGLNGALDVKLDGDDTYLYVAGQLSNAVSVFARDDTTGSLTFLDTVIDGVAGVDGLREVTGLAISYDRLLGDFLYATSFGDDAVSVFERQSDGTLVYLESARDGVRGVDGVEGANALAVSSDDQNVYVAGSGESALAVFERDVVAPIVIPELTSTSHAVGVPENIQTIDFRWSGARDDGYGVSEYWLLLDQTPDTIAPPGPPSLFVQHGVDPHTASLTAPEDDVGYFLHITTCDLIGNCSPTHLGPFVIDTLAPDAPGALVSTSHGTPSDAPEIVVKWVPASDPAAPSGYASGAVGYASSFSMSSTPECDGVIDLPDPSTSMLTSAFLDPGTWYFHLCTIDAADNNSTVAVVGPLEILPDVTPPQVAWVDSVARSADGVVDVGEELDGAITQLLVGFSERVQVAEAEDLASYLLVSPGDDGIFETTVCTILGGDDVSTLLLSASYDDGARRTALRFGSLPPDSYRLLTCSAIRDLRDNPLGGGVDQALDFGALGDHLMNPNFDTDLSGWTLSDPAASLIVDDADGATTSGAARIGVSTESEGGAQCVDTTSIPGPLGRLTLRARTRITERVPTPVRITASLTYFDQPGCAGTELSSATSEEVAGDTGGMWLDLGVKGFVPPGSLSVLARFDAVPDDMTADADVDLDRCSLRQEFPIFIDGFESGGLSAWSGTIP